MEDDLEAWLQVAHRLWVAKHDVAEDVANLAAELWTKANMEVKLFSFVHHLHSPPCTDNYFSDYSLIGLVHGAVTDTERKEVITV